MFYFFRISYVNGLCSVLDFHGQILVAGGSHSGEKLTEASPSLVEPRPASSRMDPKLAKAGLTRNGDNVSVISYFRRS